MSQRSLTHEKPTRVLLSEEKETIFSQLYVKYYDAMFLMARRVLRSEELAEDVVHDVFLDFISKWDRLGHVRELQSYIMVATYNQALKRLQKLTMTVQATKEFLLTVDREDHIPADRQEPNLATSEKLINSLSPRLRKAFVLVNVEGLSTKEASERLSISSSTLYQRLHRATALMKKHAKQTGLFIFILACSLFK